MAGNPLSNLPEPTTAHETPNSATLNKETPLHPLSPAANHHLRKNLIYAYPHNLSFYQTKPNHAYKRNERFSSA